MHVLLCTVHTQLYAVSTRSVCEVTPVVQLRPVPQSPPWAAGIMHYRGQFLPVVDLPRLLGRVDWTPRMASRILIVAPDPADPSEPVGLWVESVLGNERIEFPARRDDHNTPSGSTLLGPLVTTPYGTVQRLELEDLPRFTEAGFAGDFERPS